MEQKVEAPNPEELAHLERQRTWVRGHFTPESQHLYQDFDQKLTLLDAILKNGWIEARETWKLQSLGITLGDALVQKFAYEWVTVEDDHGRDPALRVQGTSLLLFPLTMISKRVERGETVDVYRLFEGLCKLVDERKRAEGVG